MPLRIGCRADDIDKHEFDVNSLLFHNGKLYSAADDGKIKMWTPDLTKITEVQSNPCSVYCLAASENTLFSCSNEGTIKSFDSDTLEEKGELIRDSLAEFWSLSYSNGVLYSGDSEGYIKFWKNGEVIGSLSIGEPVKDMVVFDNKIFSVKDLDLVITDLSTSAEKQEGSKQSFMGRAPVTTVGKEYFSFVSREGTDLFVHENNNQSHFRAVTKVKGAHEKIINALAGAKWNEKNIIFSGGWDKLVKKWIIENNRLKLDSACDVEIVVNSIVTGEEEEIYVAGSDGHILRLEDE
ncbi:unnamed protein product [Phaedon cochleariae]|uniref:Uncharacterized protein n=1 Tax=Phaedon cochleariae TaxID=80249 RepID=A0A9P0DLZ0_PHACE|nr:unnamed protein product [Phaedon cochleariae]